MTDGSSRRAMTRPVVLVLAGCFAAATSGVARASTVTFSDGTFDLSGYTIATQLASGGTVTAQQVLSGGNPGAALETSFNGPGGAQVQLYLNNAWTFDPSSQGTLQSLGFSAQRMFDASTGMAGATISEVIEQGGQYYVYSAPTVPYTVGQWITVTSTAVQSSAFALYNLTTNTLDATQHPNFSAGPMTFGFRAAQSGSGIDFFTDNVSFTLSYSPVPIPGTVWLLLSTVGGLGLLVRRQPRATHPALR